MKEHLIVHYITRDKFTTGYINFMQTVMTRYEHCFITASEGFDISPVKEARVVYTAHNRELFTSKEIRALLDECCMFIMSGCGLAQYAALLPESILKKTYFHFWGADFYGMRTPVIHDGRPHPKWLIRKTLAKQAFKEANGLVFLIDGEYEKFVEITGVKNRHFVAPMPGDPCNLFFYKEFVSEEHLTQLPQGKVRISVGHSATKECCHLDALHKLEKFKNEDIEIICPLSYGDEVYAREVIACGEHIFGDKFKPITEYMDVSEYIKLLSACDVGINNSDRQHGMANIGMLLGTGAKFYMRSDTSMWNIYKKRGFVFDDVSVIENYDFQKFISLAPKLRKKNIEIQDDLLRTLMRSSKEQWSVVIEDAMKVGS